MVHITTLIENRVSGKNLKCEHGLSFHIQTNEGTFLFDVGQSGKFIENAQKLGIAIDKVDALVLSHGHYDHAGGLFHFFQINQTAKVYMHPQALKQRFSQSAKMIKANGIPWREEWQQYKDRFVFVEDPLSVVPGVDLLPNIESLDDYRVVNPRLVVKHHDELVPDPFDDELVMLVNGKDGPVLFCGCAHNGIVNILHHVKKHLGVDNFQMVIGGLHLSGQAQEEITKVLKGTLGFKVARWALNHCTGDEAIALFETSYPGQVSYCDTGCVFKLS